MAAVAPAKPVSNITVAFAGQSACVKIPKAHASNHHDPHGLPNKATKNHGMLPTPPNSISPTLPPYKAAPFQSTPTSNPPILVDSDVELQDAEDPAELRDQPQALSSAALSGLEAHVAITPAMLAKEHLPNIILNDGPIAIRHILSCLAQTVPGFSRIPQAKARRVVVGALESKTGGGPDGDVLFEKVGWGRWDARVKGQPPRERRPSQQLGVSIPDGSGQLGISPPASAPDSYSGSHGSGAGLKIPCQRHGNPEIYSASWASRSFVSSPGLDEEMDDSDMHMAAHEADKMSLDGSSSASDDLPEMDDLDDMTDEEDWAAVGAAALRRGSFPPKYGQRRDYNYYSLSSTSRMKPTPSLRPYKSGKTQHHPYRSHQRPGHPSSLRSTSGPTPVNIPPSTSRVYTSNRTSSLPNTQGSGFSPHGVSPPEEEAAQERAAIEALVRMGSM